MTSRAPGIDSAMYFRDELRRARERALADSEGYAEIFVVLDALGSFVTNDPGATGWFAYTPALTDLARAASIDGGNFDVLFGALRETRNDAMHEGAAARRAVTQAVEVALVLEDALASAVSLHLVKHFMIPNPVCAEPWQTLKIVRQTMLAHQFSFLPILIGGEWRLIADFDVAAFLRHSQRKTRLNTTVEAAWNAVAPADRLHIVEGLRTTTESPVEGIFDDHKHLPRLVLSPTKNLLGILTAFDLL